MQVLQETLRFSWFALHPVDITNKVVKICKHWLNKVRLQKSLTN